MVAISDLKMYKTTNFLGGAITATEVFAGTPNNIFTNVPKNELVVGEDYYACVFLKNTHATEKMDNVKWWLSSKTFPHDTELKWGFEPTAETGGYHYSPYFTGTGTEFDSTASTTDLQLATWTICAWFRTTATGSEMFIVNKGGTGSDTAGQNDNYSLRMTTTNKIRAGFEEGSGTDHYADSPLTYNDGLWHFALATYGGANVNLYVDDMVTPVATHATSAAPETVGTNPVVIGRNSRASDKFWIGDIDEVRVYENVKTEETRINLMNGNITQLNLKLEKKFGADDNSVVAQTIPDKYTAPVGVTWFGVESEPEDPNIGEFLVNETTAIWLWLHVPANSEARIDDAGTFTIKLDIPLGGTGSTGGGGTGGTGGNPPPTPTDYKVAIAGDWGCSSTTDSVISLIQSQGYGHVCGVGDNAYSSASCWTTRFNPLKSIMNSAYGNHEYSESGGVTPYKTFFSHSLTYFTYKYQNIQFFVFDTNINCDIGGAQHNAMKSALEASQTDNTVVWRIAVFHHPQMGASSSHSYNDANTIQNFTQMFLDNKINFVCCGHNHNFQRTHQVEPDTSNPSSPTVIDGTAPYSRTARAYIHVVSGAGGHDSGSGLYSLGTQPTYQAFQARTKNGVWELVASNSGNTLTCSFVDTDETKYDTFVIS